MDFNWVVFLLLTFLRFASAADNKQLPANDTQPTANDTQPTANDTLPTANDMQPTANDTQPTANNTQPTANDALPTANDTQPTANNTQPTANDAQISDFPDHLALSIADDPSEKCVHAESNVTNEGNISLCFSDLHTADKRFFWRNMTLSVSERNLSIVTQVRRVQVFATGAVINIPGEATLSIRSLMGDQFPYLPVYFNGYGNASGSLNGSVTFTGWLNARMFEGKVMYREHNVTHVLHCPHDNTLGPDFYTDNTCITCEVSVTSSLHSHTPLGWRTPSRPLCKEGGVETADPGMADRHRADTATSNRQEEDGEEQAPIENGDQRVPTTASPPFNSFPLSDFPGRRKENSEKAVMESVGFPRFSENHESDADNGQPDTEDGDRSNALEGYSGKESQTVDDFEDNNVNRIRSDNDSKNTTEDVDSNSSTNDDYKNNHIRADSTDQEGFEQRPVRASRHARLGFTHPLKRDAKKNKENNINDDGRGHINTKGNAKDGYESSSRKVKRQVLFSSPGQRDKIHNNKNSQRRPSGKASDRYTATKVRTGRRTPFIFSQLPSSSNNNSVNLLVHEATGAVNSTDGRMRKGVKAGGHTRMGVKANLNENYGSRSARTARQAGYSSKTRAEEAFSCSLHLVSDHLFFTEMGDRNPAKTVNLMVSVVVEADALFRLTDFDGDGDKDNIGFVVKNVTIIRKKEAASYSYSRANGNAYQYLKNFSAVDFSDVCLGVAFTAIDFEKGVVGLAWYGSSMNGGAGKGGICGQRVFLVTEGRSFSFNTAILTFINHGSPVSLSKAVLTLAHEFGHCFGASHDDSTGSTCNREYPQGQFLMHRYRPSQFNSNNNRFSPCSIRQMYPVLVRKGGCLTRYAGPVCGNGVIEGSEECDCGKANECANKDPCCTPGDAPPSSPDPPCALRRSLGYQCSPVRSSCCNAECRPVSLSDHYVCREASDCMQQAVCDGHSPRCPPFSPNPDGTLCHGGLRVCAAGECRGSLCRRAGLQDCFCTNTTQDLCKLCCRQNAKSPCLTASALNVSEQDVYYLDGDACLDYKGVCITSSRRERSVAGRMEGKERERVCQTDEGGSVDESFYNLLGAAGMEDGLESSGRWLSNNWFYFLLIPLLPAGVGVIVMRTRCVHKGQPSNRQNTWQAERLDQLIRTAESRSQQFRAEAERTSIMYQTLVSSLQHHQRRQFPETERPLPGHSSYRQHNARRRSHSAGAVNLHTSSPKDGSLNTPQRHYAASRLASCAASDYNFSRSFCACRRSSTDTSQVESDLEQLSASREFSNIPPGPGCMRHANSAALRMYSTQPSRRNSRSSYLGNIKEMTENPTGGETGDVAGPTTSLLGGVGAFNSASFTSRVQRWLRGEGSADSGSGSSRNTTGPNPNTITSDAYARHGHRPLPAATHLPHRPQDRRTHISSPTRNGCAPDRESLPTLAVRSRSLALQNPHKHLHPGLAPRPHNSLSSTTYNTTALQEETLPATSNRRDLHLGTAATLAPSQFRDNLPTSACNVELISCPDRAQRSRSSGLLTLSSGLPSYSSGLQSFSSRENNPGVQSSALPTL